MKQEIFVGNAALGVPQSKKGAKRNGEGAVPYRLIFLINKIDLHDYSLLCWFVNDMRQIKSKNLT